MITVSLVILTHNRSDAVYKSLTANLATAWYPIHEIIHVDNGSDDIAWFGTQFKPAIQVLHSTNLGVAKGYNRGMMLATGSHIVITGCDRIMPQGWLNAWVNAFEEIPETGVISCHTVERNTSTPTHLYRGINIKESPPYEARMHSREFLHKVGLFREDFGVYGYEDVEWADRVMRTTNCINYTLPDLGLALHLPDGNDGAYKAMKDQELSHEWKKRLIQRCHEAGNPYYNPYTREEKPI